MREKNRVLRNIDKMCKVCGEAKAMCSSTVRVLRNIDSGILMKCVRCVVKQKQCALVQYIYRSGNVRSEQKIRRQAYMSSGEMS